MHSDDVPEGFYKEDGKLRKQHDTFGGPHDEDRDTPKLDALVVGEPPFEEAEPDLVMQIMGQMVNNAHDSWSTLNDAKDRDIEKLRAELNLVRDQMNYLLEQPYAPAERFIVKALYPSPKQIDDAIKSGMGDFRYGWR